MKPEGIGRVLGVGVRVAGRIAGQRMAAGARNAQAAAHGSAGIVRGLGGILRPFRRAGGIVWLEVTGAFFLLFALAFARALWRMRTGWLNGEDQPGFLFFAALMAVFFYLGVSSFWRARRR